MLLQERANQSKSVKLEGKLTLNDELWRGEVQNLRQQMAAFGATLRLGLKDRDGSVFLAHADFGAYEGPTENIPYLRLHLCTAHVGRLYQVRADGSKLDAVLRPGMVGVTLPDIEAEGYWPKTQTLSIMVNPNRLAEICQNEFALTDIEPATTVLHRDPLLSSVMSALWRDAEAYGLTSAFFDHGLALILRRLSDFRKCTDAAVTRPVRPLGKAVVKSVRELIESRLGGDLSVSELADESGQDIRSFTRSFKASTGFAPYEYLTMRRMERAKELLDAGKSVTEVSLTVGYSNPSKFAAAFRRFCGCSPSQWRGRRF